MYMYIDEKISNVPSAARERSHLLDGDMLFFAGMTFTGALYGVTFDQIKWRDLQNATADFSQLKTKFKVLSHRFWILMSYW